MSSGNSRFRKKPPRTIRETTPRKITEYVRTFCRTLAEAEPVYVPVKPYYPTGFCVSNCWAQVREYGGKIVPGFCIWESDTLIEGEYHSVWRNPEGALIDVTKKPDGESRILFVTLPEMPVLWQQLLEEMESAEKENITKEIDGRKYIMVNKKKWK